jgi:hypothetical protein
LLPSRRQNLLLLQLHHYQWHPHPLLLPVAVRAPQGEGALWVPQGLQGQLAQQASADPCCQLLVLVLALLLLALLLELLRGLVQPRDQHLAQPGLVLQQQQQQQHEVLQCLHLPPACMPGSPQEHLLTSLLPSLLLHPQLHKQQQPPKPA